MASDKDIQKAFESVWSNYRQGKPTAELLSKLDATVMSTQFPEAFRRLQIANNGVAALDAIRSNPSFYEVFLREARTRAEAGVVADDATAQIVLMVYESLSTAHLALPNTVAVGLSHNFIDALLLTDFEEAEVEGLQNPFPGTFAIRLPRGIFVRHTHMYDSAPFPLQLITLTPYFASRADIDKVNRDSFGFLTIFRTGLRPDATALYGNNLTFGAFLPLTIPGASTLTIGELLADTYLPFQHSTYVIVDEESGEEVRTGRLPELLNVIYGTLLYLNTPNPSLARASTRKSVTIRDLVVPPKKARKLKARKPSRTWETIIVTERVKDISREERRTGYAHWRRGHIRSQPYGPGRALRRPQWIQPTIVHREGPGMPRKDYEIEGLS